MFAAAALMLFLDFGAPYDFVIDAGQSTRIAGFLTATAPLTHPHLHIQVADGVLVTAVKVRDWTCVQDGGAIDCTAASYDAAQSVVITIDVAAPADSTGGRFPITAAFTSDEDAAGYHAKSVVNVRHHIAVRSTADSGEDTLRAAIEAADRDCASMPDCAIDFDLPQPAKIDLLTPLPAITAPALIMNADVELTGEHLKSGSGLLIRPENASYPGFRFLQLKIHDFPENGIDYAGWTPDVYGALPLSIRICDIERNGLRGVSVSAHSVAVDLEENTISHNGRSGVALWDVSGGGLTGNTIEWNGAAGVYVGSTQQYVVVSQGLIAFNDIGVAINSKTATAAVIGASMGENVADDLDWGLDGNNGPGAESGPAIPVLLSASYDPASNTTTVAGEVHDKGTFTHIVLYASDHVTRWGNTPMTNIVYQLAATRQDGADGFSFTMTIPGDYRGAFISAQSTIQAFPDLPVTAASELGPAIQVPR